MCVARTARLNGRGIQNELRAVTSVFGKRDSSDSTRLCMRPLFRTRTCGSVYMYICGCPGLVERLTVLTPYRAGSCPRVRVPR
eukprot:4432720-Prymnesium_polylepis.1